MSEVKSMVAEFIRKYGMDSNSIDYEDSCLRFIREMENGLSGRESSLAMIPTYIKTIVKIPVDEDVIIIDAGGTNLRIALVRFTHSGNPVISGFSRHMMPGSTEEIGIDMFYDILCGYIKPFLSKSRKLGFCFSYPVEILPDRDGRLISFSKEVRVKGLEGRLVGIGLQYALARNGFGRLDSIVMLNDTVATLLAGKSAFPGKVFDDYVGFILGTGTNTCYIEKTANISKLKAGWDGDMIVNIESGAYNGFPESFFDKQFDKDTDRPGKYRFEKMISGAYQGGLLTRILHQASEEGLLSGAFNKNFSRVRTLSAKDINEFLDCTSSVSKGIVLADCCAAAGTAEGENDREVVYHLADAMVERAARLVSINLASVILKTGKGADPRIPVCIMADGSTFYKSRLLRNKLDYFVRTLLNERSGIHCEFARADNSVILGSAIAGLS